MLLCTLFYYCFATMALFFVVSSNSQISIFFFSFFFLRASPMHMEVPRLRVEWELQLLAYGMPQPQQGGILNSLSEARDQTRILMDTSQIHFHCTTTGTPSVLIFIQKSFSFFNDVSVLNLKKFLLLNLKVDSILNFF